MATEGKSPWRPRLPCAPCSCAAIQLPCSTVVVRQRVELAPLPEIDHEVDPGSTPTLPIRTHSQGVCSRGT